MKPCENPINHRIFGWHRAQPPSAQSPQHPDTRAPAPRDSNIAGFPQGSTGERKKRCGKTVKNPGFLPGHMEYWIVLNKRWCFIYPVRPNLWKFWEHAKKMLWDSLVKDRIWWNKQMMFLGFKTLEEMEKLGWAILKRWESEPRRMGKQFMSK